MEKIIKVDYQSVKGFLTENEISYAKEKAYGTYDILTKGTGRGNDFLGWLDLPSLMDEEHVMKIENVSAKWKEKVDLIVVVGIGGSYLGAKAAIEALSHSFSLHLGSDGKPDIVFAGQNLSEDYMSELMDLVKVRSSACVVISKSGTTTEPAVAFRILKQHFEEKYGKKESSERIVAITDQAKGALKGLATQEGYTTFVIPDDVGGRYSVLTPVGLLPIALAGFDIRAMLKGASDMKGLCYVREDDNPAIEYAAVRNALYSKGWKIEILVNYNPKFQYFAEWWKQLFGESEGKEGKGIYPSSVNFTTDLHSMGQYIQNGERTLFETVLSVREPARKMVISDDPQNLDGLNFLSGKRLDECNKMAELGTRIAHVDGGVPNIQVEIGEISEYTLGALFYFFEFACGVSAYMIEINPFDQPGVEDYKKNMFALLGKPGYEKLAEELRKRVR